MKKSLKRLIAVTGVAALALTITACNSNSTSGSSGSDSGEDGSEPISITLASQANEAGFTTWLAGELGYFEDNGITTKITYAANGAALLGSGAAGDWQAGWIGGPPAITGYKKFGLMTVGTMMREDRNLKLVMPKSELAGSSPAEILKTKKVGTTTNSTWEQMLFACAQHFGLDPAELNIVPLDPPAVRQALKAGRVTAGTTASSQDYDLLKSTDKYKVVCDGETAGIRIVDPYVVTPKFASAHPDAAAGFLEAAYRANEFINEHPDELTKYLKKFYESAGIKSSMAAGKFSMSFRDFPSLDDALKSMKDGSTLKALKATAEFFVKAGVYDSLPDLEKDLSQGQKILEQAAKIHAKHKG